MVAAIPWRVKLHPMPNTTSASRRYCRVCPVTTGPPVPRASGWSSGKALFPSRVVMTGAWSSSASSTRSSDASAYSTPWPAWITGRRASRSTRGAVSTSRPVGVDQGVGHLLVHEVGGDLDHHRAGAAHAHQADGPAHDVRDLTPQRDR